jgi:hypothetical protein
VKRLLAAIVAAVFAFSAQATTTWSRGARRYTAIATCTTGTESAPSGTSSILGLELTGLEGFTVYAEAGGAMTAGGFLQAYLQNPASGNWVRAPDLDLTAQALSSQAFAGFTVNGGSGRIAYVPSGIGLAVTIYIVGMPRVN